MLRPALNRRINRVLEPFPCAWVGFDFFGFQLLGRLGHDANTPSETPIYQRAPAASVAQFVTAAYKTRRK
jgi:hypothetical protein